MPGGRRAFEHGARNARRRVRGAAARARDSGATVGGHGKRGRQRRAVPCGRIAADTTLRILAQPPTPASMRGRGAASQQVARMSSKRHARLACHAWPAARGSKRMAIDDLEARVRRGRRHRRGAAGQPAGARASAACASRQSAPGQRCRRACAVRAAPPAASARSASDRSWSITGSAKPACTSMSPRSCMSTNGVERRPPAAVARTARAARAASPGRRSRTSGSRRPPAHGASAANTACGSAQACSIMLAHTSSALRAGRRRSATTTASACGPQRRARPPGRQARTLLARAPRRARPRMRCACG